MSTEKNKPEQQQDQADGDASVMNDEELESVSGGCQWGDTMYPKLTVTEPIIPLIDPTQVL
jgi:bacteriocin-like protein